ncbi:hypothetical protein TIFTF001_004729, partial [Ficus carica]
MTTVPKLFTFFFSLLLLSNFITTEARPFNAKKWEIDARRGILAGFFDGLSLESIKQSGPSPSGEGHRFADGQTLVGIKNSGPSPGQGSKFTNSQTLGGIKDGPSPGGGHKF